MEIPKSPIKQLNVNEIIQNAKMTKHVKTNQPDSFIYILRSHITNSHIKVSEDEK